MATQLNMTEVASMIAQVVNEANMAGDTSWMLVSTALVFWMTPGLSLFYGGLVHRKNVVNTMQMSLISIAVITCLWFICSYSFALGPNGSFLGDGSWIGLNSVGMEPNGDYAATIPHIMFMAYQLQFAIITPALISGAIVERMSFRAYMIFLVLWSLLVYNPVCHWTWAGWTDSTGQYQVGWLRKYGVLDFAGGNVVHAISGTSSLVAAWFVGPRRGYPEETSPPHNLPLAVLGTGMLWVGWYGFNGGSALASNALASQAFVNTHLAASSAFLTWTVLESMLSKPSVAGACTGAVVGLVVITPAAGFVPIWSSIVIGFLGALGVFSVIFLKHKYLGANNFQGKIITSIDDSLDAFGCHGVGGFLGAIFTGLFSSKEVNALGADGAFFGNPKQLGIQISSSLICILWAMSMSSIILIVIKYTLGLRVSESAEKDGLDIGEHGEVGYHLINREILNAGHNTHFQLDVHEQHPQKITEEHKKENSSKDQAKQELPDTASNLMPSRITESG